MDKYDQAVAILLAHVNSEERENVKLVLDVIADALRGIKQIEWDIDRIASALDRREQEE